MSPVIVSNIDGTTCPICLTEFKTLAGLSKHMNSSVHTSVKKDISQIFSEELPGIRVTFLKDKDDNLVCHYDVDAAEEVVQQMVALMERLKIKCTFERMPF